MVLNVKEVLDFIGEKLRLREEASSARVKG